LANDDSGDQPYQPQQPGPQPGYGPPPSHGASQRPAGQQGYPPQGYPPQGYGPPPQGYGAPQGYPQQGHGGPQGYGPPAQQPKKRKKWPFIVGGILLLFIIVGIAGGNGSGQQPGATGLGASGASDSASDKAAVVYEIVDAKNAGNITYSAGSGMDIAQENGVKLPWKKEVSMDRGFSIATLTAQNAGSGKITCRITVDGKVAKEVSSQGQYAVVSCTSEPITN
jgi:hypothetical protein